MRIMLDPGHGGSDPGACNGAHHEAVYAATKAERQALRDQINVLELTQKGE